MVLEAHRARCTRQLAANAKRNAKFLSSREKTVRSIARIASQSARTPAAASNSRETGNGTGKKTVRRFPFPATRFWALAQKISHPFNGLGHTCQGNPHRVPLGEITHKDRGMAAPIADLEGRDLVYGKFSKNLFGHIFPPSVNDCID